MRVNRPPTKTVPSPPSASVQTELVGRRVPGSQGAGGRVERSQPGPRLPVDRLERPGDDAPGRRRHERHRLAVEAGLEAPVDASATTGRAAPSPSTRGGRRPRRRRTRRARRPRPPLARGTSGQDGVACRRRRAGTPASSRSRRRASSRPEVRRPVGRHAEQRRPRTSRPGAGPAAGSRRRPNGHGGDGRERGGQGDRATPHDVATVPRRRAARLRRERRAHGAACSRTVSSLAQRRRALDVPHPGQEQRAERHRRRRRCRRRAASPAPRRRPRPGRSRRTTAAGARSR